MTLKLLVLLVALTLLVRRFLPRYRLSWYVPVVVGVTIVAVRGLAYSLES